MYWLLVVAGLQCGQVAPPSPTNSPRLPPSPGVTDDGGRRPAAPLRTVIIDAEPTRPADFGEQGVAGLTVDAPRDAANGDESRPDAATDDSEPSDDPDIGNVSGLSEVLEALIRTHLPNHYQDQKQWGKTKVVWSGVKVSLDGLRVDSERRHKRVNHGNWKRYRIDLRQPNEHLPLDVSNVHETDSHRLHFDITTTAPVHVWGEVAKWERGVKLGSISGEADAVVRFRGGFDLGIEFDTSKFPPDVMLRPSVTEAKIEMVSFRLQRLSHLDGPLVKHLGEGLRGVLDNKLDRTNATLVAKLNHQIAKKRDKLRWSSADWMQKKLGLASKDTLSPPREGASRTESPAK